MTLTIDLSNELEAALKTQVLWREALPPPAMRGRFLNELWEWTKSRPARPLKPGEDC